MRGIKKTLSLVLVFMLVAPLFLFSYAENKTENPVIFSESYIVSDALTGQIYMAKNENLRKYPASITKLLTVALVLEDCDLNDVITVSRQAITLTEGATRAGLGEGEQITVRDALMATCLISANDAANCLAEYANGSVTAFVDRMNQKAKELGCVSTNFVNTNGLHEDNHYTTAYDLSLIMQYVATVDNIFDFIGEDSYTMPATNMYGLEREFENGCLMLLDGEFKYDAAIGGKTGWETTAKHTMITFAKKGGKLLVAVVLDSNARNEKFLDTKNLFDFCFENFSDEYYYPQSFSFALSDGTNKTVNPDKIKLCLPPDVSVQDIHGEYLDADNLLSAISRGYITLCLNDSNRKMPNNFYVIKIPIETQQVFSFVLDNPISSFFESDNVPVWQKLIFVVPFAVIVLIAIAWYRKAVGKVRHMGHRHRRKASMQLDAEKDIASKETIEYTITEQEIADKQAIIGRLFETLGAKQVILQHGLCWLKNDSYYRTQILKFPKEPYILIQTAPSAFCAQKNKFKDGDAFPLVSLSENELLAQIEFALFNYNYGFK